MSTAAAAAATAPFFSHEGLHRGGVGVSLWASTLQATLVLALVLVRASYRCCS